MYESLDPGHLRSYHIGFVIVRASNGGCLCAEIGNSVGIYG